MQDYKSTDAKKPAYDKDKILTEIKENIRKWYEYNQHNIRNYKDDRAFVYLSQWRQDQIFQMNQLGKPILQSNIVYDVINKIVAEYRSNTGELQVTPIDGDESDEAMKEKIKVTEDHLRKVCFESNSEIAYQQAFENIISGGFGVICVKTDYEHPNSVHKIPIITFDKEPERVFFDVFAQEPTKSDGQFCGKYYTLSRKDFESKYPNIPYPSSFPYEGNTIDFNWGNKDGITIVRYFKKEWYNFTLNVLDDGRMVRDEEFEEIRNKVMMDNQANIESGLVNMVGYIPEPVVVDKVKKKDCKIKFFEAIFDQIIEEGYFPGRELPFVFCPGPSVIIDGRETFISTTRYAKDPQALHNFIMVEIAYAIQIARREQFIGTPDNVEGLEQSWKNPSVVQGILLAKRDPITGELPSKLPATEVPASLIQLFSQSELAVHSGMGFFEANTGKDSLEKSGVAIEKQQLAGSLSAVVAKSNLDRGIEQVGRIILSASQELYDVDRKVFLVDKNRKPYQKRIDGGVLAGSSFNVTLKAGPSFVIQREKSLDVLIKLISAYPQAAPLVADFIAEKSGFDNTPALVERLRTLVPPDIIAKEEGKPMPQAPPDPSMILMQKQIELKEKDQELQVGKLQLELQKTQAQMAKLRADIQQTQMKAEAEVRKAALEHNSAMVDSTARIVTSHNDLRKERQKGFYSNNRDKKVKNGRQ